jgi:hypothetical protein
MTLDENIDFLTEQKRTFELVLANARRVADARASQVRSLNQEVGNLRDTVRTLRQTLLSDGRLPSAAAIRNRLELENAIRRDEQQSAQFSKSISRFGELSAQWRAIEGELQSLPRDDVTEADRKKIQVWSELIRSQLVQYGFKSFGVDRVIVSPDTYRPEHAGFDLEASIGMEAQRTVSLQTSISASDLIRTIWSYLNGMLELARTESANHPGCIIFDEPRQQSTRDVSFAELLRRASAASAAKQQLIFFTSENLDRLKGHLNSLPPHTLNAIQGRVLKKLASDART